MHKRLWIFMILTVFLSGSAHGQIEATLKVGVILPLSGPTAPYGKQILAGLEAALNETREKDAKLADHIQVYTRDNEGLIQKTEEVGRDLLRKQKVHILVGPLTSLTTQPLVRLAAEYQKPLLIPAATDAQITDRNDYVFRTCLVDPKQGNILARFAYRNLRKRKAAILTEQGNAYAQEVSKAFAQTFRQLGGSVSDFTTYEKGTQDFALYLGNIARNSPDIILLPSYLEDVGRIISQARKLNIKTPFLGPDSWDSPNLYNVATAGELRGSYYMTHFSAQDPHPSVKEFVSSFTKKKQNEPSTLAAMGFDAMQVIIDTFKKTHSIRSEVLVRQLNTATTLPTLFGGLQFDKNHEAHKPGIVMVATSSGSQFMTRLYPEK